VTSGLKDLSASSTEILEVPPVACTIRSVTFLAEEALATGNVTVVSLGIPGTATAFGDFIFGTDIADGNPVVAANATVDMTAALTGTSAALAANKGILLTITEDADKAGTGYFTVGYTIN
jgi:hypothetical protein